MRKKFFKASKYTSEGAGFDVWHSSDGRVWVGLIDVVTGNGELSRFPLDMDREEAIAFAHAILEGFGEPIPQKEPEPNLPVMYLGADVFPEGCDA